MKKYTVGTIDTYVSKEMMDELNINYAEGYKEIEDIKKENMEERLTKHNLDHAIRSFFDENPEYKKVIDLYSKLIKKNKVVCLSAHGGDNDYGEWVFEHNKQEYSVQDWINKQDGKYAAILLNVCNESGRTITSKKSMVLAPNYIWGDFVKWQEGGQLLDLYLPKKGYLDSYTIDYEISELEKKIKNV